MPTVALLHPGGMGAAVGGQLVRAGCPVRWLRAGRSDATRQRAEEHGLTPAGDLAELLDGVDLVVSICPPQGAVSVASSVAGAGFAGVYLDANPLGPDSLTAVRRAVEGAGSVLVDGGIVGSPPLQQHPDRVTRLLLSGPIPAVGEVQRCFAGTSMTVASLGDQVGAASAAKASYALFNKGRLALAYAARELATAYGVEATLAEEGQRPGAAALVDEALDANLRAVAWRYAPEFDEIAASLSAAGLDASIARSVAAVYRRLA